MDEYDIAYLVGLLWSEIPLDKEAKVIQRMHDEGVYALWEEACNMTEKG